MTKEARLQIINLYNNSKYTVQEIADKYNVCKCTVYNLTKQYRIQDNKRSKKVKNNPFENLNSEYVQYWLGFLSADGSIYKDRITLSLKGEDEEILLKFQAFLGNVNITKGVYKKFGKEFSYYRIAFRSKKIVQYLHELGITERKTKTIKLNFKMTSHFLRGLIDGDGTICKSNRNIVRVFTASVEFVKQISEFLTKNDINHHIYIKKSKSMFYDIQINKNSEVLKIINFLYNNANIFLKRKYYNATQIRNSLQKHLKFREPALGILSENSTPIG